MKKPYNPDAIDPLREKLIGLGEHSIRKSYYPELQQRLSELERFKALLDQSNDAIFLVQLPGWRITDINESACRLTDYTRASLLSMSLGEISDISSSGFDKSDNYSAFLNHANNQEMLTTYLISSDGIKIPIEITLRLAVFNEDVYAVAVARDITERNHTDEQLRKYREQLEELVDERTAELAVARDRAEAANRSKSAFLANMSHELRTPLNAILGYSKLMQRDRSLSVEQTSYLNIINRSGEHLLSLINGVLEISKIEASRVVLNTNSINLYSLLNDLKMMFHNSTRDKGLQLDLVISHTVPRYIIADENKLRQILINLIGNAVKFTLKGRVLIQVSCAYHSPDTLRLIIDVVDTGLGIADEESDKLFQYFEQTSSGRNTHGGTGLGLAISREYARMMGGEISVSSRVNEGSTFRLEIDALVDAEQISPDPVQKQRVLALHTAQIVPRILVLDDESDTPTLLWKLFTVVGFDVKLALSGREAVQIMQDWQPDIVWVEISKPITAGLEAIRGLRALPDAAAILIIALTSCFLEEEQKELLAAGCDEVLLKPCAEEKLFEIMADKLNIAFVYEDEVPSAPFPESEPPFLRISECLPEDLRKELKDAVLRLSMNQALEVIEKIIVIDSGTGMIFKRLVDNMDFDRLLNLLEGDDA